MSEVKNFEPTVACLDYIVSAASDNLMHVLGYDNFRKDWHSAGGEGFRLIDLTEENDLDDIYVDEVISDIDPVETAVLDIGEYRYKLPVTLVPQILLGHLEVVLNLYKDEISYPGVDEDVDYYQAYLTKSLEELRAADAYFQLREWVRL